MLAVITYHCGLTEGGYIGVSVFFALSGYLITGLLLAEQSRTHTVSLRDFYIRRGLRLYPALITVLVAFTIVFVCIRPPATYGQTWLGSIASVTYVNDFVSALGHRSVFGPTWSLGVEEQFYLLWPALLLLTIRRFGVARAGRLTLAAAVLLAVIYAPLAAIDTRTGSGMLNWLYYSPLGNIAPLLLGAALAFRPTLRAPLWLTILAGVVLLVMIDRAPLKNSAHLWWGLDQLLVLGSLVLIAGAQNLRWLFGNRALVWIGRRSYGIYLIHFPLLAIVLTTSWSGSVSKRLLVVVPGTLILAALMYAGIEAPALRLKSRFGGSSRE